MIPASASIHGIAPTGSQGNATVISTLITRHRPHWNRDNVRSSIGGIYSGSPSSSSSSTTSSSPPEIANSFKPSNILPRESPSSHCLFPLAGVAYCIGCAGCLVSGIPAGWFGDKEMDKDRRLERRGLEAEGNGV